MTSIETKNRRLRRAFIFVVLLIVILVIAEVVLVTVMLTRNNGKNGQSPTFSEINPNDKRDLTNKSVVAIGGQLSDRRYPSTANPQEKTAKTIVKTYDDTASFTTDPEGHLPTDENYDTEAPITDIFNTDSAHSPTTAQDHWPATITPSLPTVHLTTETDSNVNVGASVSAKTTSMVFHNAVESSTFSKQSAQANIKVSPTQFLRSHTSQVTSLRTDETADTQQQVSSTISKPAVTSQVLKTSFTNATIIHEKSRKTATTSLTLSNSTTRTTSANLILERSTNPLPSRASSTMSSSLSSAHTFSTNEEGLISTDTQPHGTMQPTTNSAATEFDNTTDTIITTEEIDVDFYTTTASTDDEEWMDETTMLTISSNSLNAANHPTIQPTVRLSSNSVFYAAKSTIHHTTGPSTNSLVYAVNQAITGVSNSEDVAANQSPTESTTAPSANDLQVTTTSSYGLTSTKSTEPRPGSSQKTIPPTHQVPHIFSTSSTSTTTTTTEPELCGIRYDDKCYTLIFGDMDYYDAQKTCRNVKGKLADITSRQHYNVMMAYIHQLIPESKQKLDTWTAMTLMITTGKVRLSNYNTASFTKWYPGQPQQDFNRRHIYLHVSKTKSNPQGMVNDNPKSKLPGAMCVMKKRSSNRG